MISIVYDVNRYRKILEEWIKRNDIVIELGPHTGRSTVHYLKKTKLTVVVDKSEQSRDYFKNLKSENLKFIQGDVRSFDTIKKVLEITKKCDFLAVDMGGGRYPDTVFKVWAVWTGIFKPKNSVIRNRGLAEFLQRVRIDDRSIRKKFEDNGWLSEWGRAVPYKLKEQMQEFEFWVDV